MPAVDITELQDAYVVCRTIGHSWDEDPTAQVDSDLFRISRGVLALHCTRCTMQRFDYIDQNMNVSTRYYRKPPLYDTIRGQGTRPNLRGELLRRSLIIQSHQRRNGRPAKAAKAAKR